MAENSGAGKRWTRVREIVRNRRAVWWTGGIVLAVLVIGILWKVPQWQVESYSGLTSSEWFDRVNEARKTIATILGGIVVLAGAYFTWRNIKLVQEGQITDRFTKAIEQLGAVNDKGEKKLEVRLGGIYALERIAKDSERDHWPIMEVLCTYVRENAPLKPKEGTQENQKAPAADIQAILTVLGRRDRRYEKENQRLDLHRTYLHGAELGGADLGGADLSGADLSGAYLAGANLTEAYLGGTDLSGTMFSEANLRLANLSGANLTRAYLAGADLRGAKFSDADQTITNLQWANLQGANLSGADISGVILLDQEQLNAATGDNATQLPNFVHVPQSWNK